MTPLVLASAIAAGAQLLPLPNAAFQFDYLRTKDRIETDGRSTRTVELSVLLRTPAAVSDFSQVVVPYLVGFGSVAVDSIHVVRADKTVLEAKEISGEDVDPRPEGDRSAPAQVLLRKLTIPGVAVGDKLSYRLVTTTRPIAGSVAYGDMNFSWTLMDTAETYELDIPAGLPVRVSLRDGLGAAWETVPAADGRLVRKLSVKPSPTGPAGPGAGGPDVTYSTFASWGAVGRWWWDLSRDTLRGDDATKQVVARILEGKRTPRERIDAISSFVATNVRRVETPFGRGRMRPQPAPAVLAALMGDSKDRVALLLTLAEAAGIEMRPALVSAGRFDLDDRAPGPHQFDRVIAVAILGTSEKDWLWIDAANPYSPPFVLPPSLRDRRSLVIDREGAATVVATPARPPRPMSRTVTLDAVFNTAGELKGHAHFSDRSDAEPRLRAAFSQLSAEGRDGLLRAYLGRTWTYAEITGTRTSDPADLASPFSVDFDFVRTERIARGGDSPARWGLWLPDLGPILADPAPVGSARWPVEMEVGEVSFHGTIELPEGLDAYPPDSVSVRNEHASVVVAYSAKGRTLSVDRTVQVLQPHVSVADLPSYETVLKAAKADREANFYVNPIPLPDASAEELQRRGREACVQGDCETGEKFFRKALALDPKLKDIHYDLGRVLVDRSFDEQGIQELSLEIAANPGHPDAYAQRAAALRHQHKNREAETDLRKQIAVAPQNGPAHLALARELMSQEHFREAGDLFAKGLAIDPGDPDDWMALGRALAHTGRPKEAKDALDRGMKDIADGDWAEDTAWTYAMAGDGRTAGSLARRDLQKFATVAPYIRTATMMTSQKTEWSQKLEMTWVLVGEAALAAGDLAEADRYLSPAWATAVSSRAGYSLALLREKQGKLAEAAALLAAAETLRAWDFRKPADLAERRRALALRGFRSDGSAELARVRVFTVPGIPSASSSEEVFLLAAGDRVEGVWNLSTKGPAEPGSALERLTQLRIPVPFAGGVLPVFAWRGRLTCTAGVDCKVALLASVDEEPGAVRGTLWVSSASFSPNGTEDGGLLGVTVSYELAGAGEGDVRLDVQDAAHTSLVVAKPTVHVQAGKSSVDLKAEVRFPRGLKDIDVLLTLWVGERPSTIATQLRMSTGR